MLLKYISFVLIFVVINIPGRGGRKSENYWEVQFWSAVAVGLFM